MSTIELNPYAPGVVRRQERIAEVFVGTGESLVAAGIVKLHELPGQPGNSPTSAVYFADGVKAERGMHRDDAGKKTIHARRMGGVQVFEVSIRLSRQQINAGHAAEDKVTKCWPFKDRFDAGSRGRP